jgi:hypothetical protein
MVCTAMQACMTPLGRCSWRVLGTTVLLLAAAVLWPASSPNSCSSSFQSFGARLASGQGLAVSSELLGAGEAATANQLEVFEDSLIIATTGGRGRGGRGASGNLGASAFTDADRLQQLQRGIYYIAAAPKNLTSCQFKYKWKRRRAGDTALRSDCNNFVPSRPRDQVSYTEQMLLGFQHKVTLAGRGTCLCHATAMQLRSMQCIPCKGNTAVAGC